MNRPLYKIVARLRIDAIGVAMPGVRLPERIRQIMDSAPGSRISRARTSCAIAVCAVLGGLCIAGAIAAPHRAGDSAKAASGNPVFEAASVKESAPGSRRFGILAEPGGRLTANNATLGAIIRTAYDVNPQEMIAGPEFDRLLSQRFDIEAKAQDDPPRDQMKLMLQSLLADRFKLAVHHETRQLPVFVLVVSKPAKIGPQLILHTGSANCPDSNVTSRDGASGSSSIPCGDMIVGPGHMTANKISMSDFAASLSGAAGRLVLDRTGLVGTFDLTLKYTPEQQQAVAPGPDAVMPDPQGPSLFTALQEQLGLKLDSQTAPVDVLVVDHVEEPMPN